MSGLATPTSYFNMKRSVGKSTYNYSFEKYNKIYYQLSGHKIKLVEDSRRRIIILLDKNDNHLHYHIFKKRSNQTELELGRKANMLMNKMVASLDAGEYTNKELMESILNDGIDKLRNHKSYEFNLPLLASDNDTFEQHDMQSLDLNHAYARCLFINGLISNDIYQMLINAHKDVRLRVLGMLAKQQQITTINKDDYTFEYSYKTKYYALFRFAEVNVAKNMNYMKQILTDKYFVFYWVDGIYYLKNTPKEILDTLNRYLDGKILKNVDYEYKFESIPYLKYYKEANKHFLYLTKTNKHGFPEPKLYSLSRAWLKEEAVETL